MAVSGFNVLWILCVLLLLVAFFLAVRRRRIAKRQGNQNMNTSAATHQARQAYNEVRIHMAARNYPLVVSHQTPSPPTQQPNIQMPPPAFDPEDTLPPPSYQDFQKDVRLQSNHS